MSSSPFCPHTSPWEAVARGQTEVLAALLRDEPGLASLTDYQGKTLLLCAIEARQQDAAVLMIDLGSPVDHADNFGYRAAHWACLTGQARVLQRLLSSGAEARCRTRAARCTPMMVAAAKGHHDCIAVLIRHHNGDGAISAADVDAEGLTALHHACMYGRTQAAMVLTTMGLADPNTRDCKGRTPASVAQDRRHEACVRAIQDHHRVQLLLRARYLLDRSMGRCAPTGSSSLPQTLVGEVLDHALLTLNDDMFGDLLEYMHSDL